jgi:hypothetical protein
MRGKGHTTRGSPPIPILAFLPSHLLEGGGFEVLFSVEELFILR